jgi:hypothetical protein
LDHRLELLHDSAGFSLDEYSSFYDSYKAYNMMLPKNVSQSQLGSRLIPRDVLLQNNTELVNIFRKVVNLGHDFLGTAADASKFADENQHTSVDPARRLAAFSAIFGT